MSDGSFFLPSNLSPKRIVQAALMLCSCAIGYLQNQKVSAIYDPLSVADVMYTSQVLRGVFSRRSQ